MNKDVPITLIMFGVLFILIGVVVCIGADLAFGIAVLLFGAVLAAVGMFLFFRITKENPITSNIRNRMSGNRINGLYMNGELTNSEAALLHSLKSDAFVEKYLLGRGEYKLYYSSMVDRESYFTNIEEVLENYYSIYKKYPKYHVNVVLSKALKNFADDHFSTYYALKYMEVYLNDLRDGRATFKIKNVDKILGSAKEQIKKYSDFYKGKYNYSAALYEDGYYGEFKELNETFIREANIDIFSDTD